MKLLSRFARNKHRDQKNVVIHPQHGIVQSGSIENDHYIIQNESPLPIKELEIPWQLEDTHNGLLSKLQWQQQLSEFAGCNAKMATLHTSLLNSPQNITATFITSESGGGKTRFAAQFAEMFKQQGWQCGFISLDDNCVYPSIDQGTLLIVDNPEERRDKVCELLTNLSAQNSPKAIQGPIRLLLLTRTDPEEWRTEIESCNATPLFTKSLNLVGLPSNDALMLFESTIKNLKSRNENSTLLDLSEQIVSEELFADWLSLDSNNTLPLFVLSAAIHSTVYGLDTFNLTGAQIIESLVMTEQLKLLDRSRNAGLGENTLSLLYVFATIAGDLSDTQIKLLAVNSKRLSLDFPAEDVIIDLLEAIGCIEDRTFVVPLPSLISTYLVLDILQQKPAVAADRIWFCVELNVLKTLSNMGRVSSDTLVVFKTQDNLIVKWLAQAINNNPDRCKILEEPLTHITPPAELLPIAVSVLKILIDQTKDDRESGKRLNNLAVCLANMSDEKQALKVIQEAVILYRRLATNNPALYHFELTSSLQNLSIQLTKNGNKEESLSVIQEIVDIRKRLAKEDPARFEADFANSLSTLANKLAEKGDKKLALSSLEEAVTLYTHLSIKDPEQYGPFLASCLNNLSIRLADIGDEKGALEAIQNTIDLWKCLATDYPSRFDKNLASSLNNLSIRLTDFGDNNKALGIIKNAVNIFTRLTDIYPERYECSLASSLNNFANLMANMGQNDIAIETIEKVVKIYRRLASVDNNRYDPNLASSLNNLSVYLSYKGDLFGALVAIQEAVEIRRWLTAHNPKKYEADLASSLNNLSIRLMEVGDLESARQAIDESIVIYKQLVNENPLRYEPKLANCLKNFSVHLAEAGEGKKAREAIRKAVEIHKRMVSIYPGRYKPELASSLNNLSVHLADAGIRRDARESIEKAVKLLKPYAKSDPNGKHGRWYKDITRTREQLLKNV